MSFNHVSDYLNEMRIGRRIDTWLRFELAHQRTVAFVLVDFHEEILGGELILKRRQIVTVRGKCFIKVSSIAK